MRPIYALHRLSLALVRILYKTRAATCTLGSGSCPPKPNYLTGDNSRYVDRSAVGCIWVILTVWFAPFCFIFCAFAETEDSF
jgi:hypothetical protein